MKLLTLIVSLFVTLGLTQTAVASDGAGRLKEVQEYNLDKGVGLRGYDPVSYFAEGGGTPLKGSDEFSMEFGGVTYLFANQANLDTFINEAVKNKNEGIATLKYEPTYGGWCAWAMGELGEKAQINPELYDFTGDRLHLFADGTKSLWDADKANLEKAADRRWKRILAKARRR